MGILQVIKGWFGVGIDKFKALVSKLWILGKPFLKEILSQTAYDVWHTSKDLLIEAVKYVALKGLPTEQEQKDAFYEYMRKTGNAKIKDLRTRDLNFLRELALQVYDKASE
ncbi:MAG: hypothetical protein ABFC84_16880 [Veillonellales bacterium]